MSFRRRAYTSTRHRPEGHRAALAAAGIEDDRAGRCGLRVPGDVSVAGFGDLPFSIDAVPSLTAVGLPLAEAGARAGRIAMRREEPPPGGFATVQGG